MKQLTKQQLIIIAIASCLTIVGGLTVGMLLKEKAKDKAPEEKDIKAISSGLDGDDKVSEVRDVEKVIEKWVEANPKFIVEQVVKMQKKEMEQQQESRKVKLSERKDEIFKNKTSPVFAGNNADVTIVEFFDYSCVYCKKAHEILEKVIAEDKKIKIIFKEYPILSEGSEAMSKVALAVNAIDSKLYKTVHDKLMTSQARSKEEAIKIAVESGINEDKLKKYLESNKEELTKIIDENRKLASELGIQGTPAFIIGEDLHPGYLDVDAMKEKIKQNRNK